MRLRIVRARASAANPRHPSPARPVVMWATTVSYAYPKIATSDGGLPRGRPCRMILSGNNETTRSGNGRQEQDLYELRRGGPRHPGRRDARFRRVRGCRDADQPLSGGRQAGCETPDLRVEFDARRRYPARRCPRYEPDHQKWPSEEGDLRLHRADTSLATSGADGI